MSTLLVRYNKVTDTALVRLAESLEDGKWADLNEFGDDLNLLNYLTVSAWMDEYRPFSSVVIGDVFWPTGQHICRWSTDRKVLSCFLQHGQWIYVNNKKNPQHVPLYTCVYGGNVRDMIKTWPYYGRSRVVVTGNPRYDNIPHMETEGFVYFAPPVLSEQVEGFQDKWSEYSHKKLKDYSGLDKEVDLAIHPHYREGNVDMLRDLFPNARFINSKDNPLVHVAKCKSVVTHRNSTTVLDAIACHKMTILIEAPSFFRKGYFGPFAHEAKTVQDVVIGTDRGIQVYNYDEEAYPYIYLGNASKRIAEIIE